MNDTEPTSALKWLTTSFVIGALIVYAVLAVAYGFIALKLAGGLSSAGQFGDMFGAFNAFVSGIAMLGVVAAILLQREQNRMQAEELRLQRQELAETRAELQGQKEALQSQASAAKDQLARWDKDYIERNKPVVFCDRWEDPNNARNFYYVMRNVGGGFAINVYFIDASEPTAIALALGSLASNSERKMPEAVNDALVAASAGARHILIAEGAPSRTTQWTPTLNYRTAANDIRRGHVQPRVADVAAPASRDEPQSLMEFRHNNQRALLDQLNQFGTSLDS